MGYAQTSPSDSYLTPSPAILVLARFKLCSFGIPKVLSSSMESSLIPLLEETSSISKLWCHCNKEGRKDHHIFNGSATTYSRKRKSPATEIQFKLFKRFY